MNNQKQNRFQGLMQVIRQESSQTDASNTDISLTTTSTSSSNNSEVLWVPRHKIHRDPEQSRRYFDEDELKNMAASIRAVGIIDPLSVRLKTGTVDEYELLAGEKRHRSAEIAQIELLPVRVFQVDNLAAENIKAISNLQRSDLNKWEETNAIMGMLCRHLNKSQTEVISLLNQAANQKRGLTDNVVRSEEWSAVLDVFTLVGRMTPESFRKHRVPLLKLPESIQVVLQQGKLHYTKVNEILKVKDPVQQQELLEEVITHNLSVDEIQERIKRLRQEQQAASKPTKLSIPQRLASLSHRAKQSHSWQDPRKSKKMEALLNKLEELLN